MNNVSFLFENFQFLEMKFSIQLIRRVFILKRAQNAQIQIHL